MPQLVSPDVSRHAAWLAAHREWGPGLHEDGFGIGPDDDVESTAGFAVWVDGLASRPGRMWWVVEGDDVLGGIVLRPFTDERVLRLGHIGFGIRPSARGRGLASWALGEVLVRAREAGLARVLLVCLDDNTASIRTITRGGGVLDQVVADGPHLVRHYWVELDHPDTTGD